MRRRVGGEGGVVPSNFLVFVVCCVSTSPFFTLLFPLPLPSSFSSLALLLLSLTSSHFILPHFYISSNSVSKQQMKREECYDVVVVGGGASGLHCADLLRTQGVNVVVLEAREVCNII